MKNCQLFWVAAQVSKHMIPRHKMNGSRSYISVHRVNLMQHMILLSHTNRLNHTNLMTFSHESHDFHESYESYDLILSFDTLEYYTRMINQVHHMNFTILFVLQCVDRQCKQWHVLPRCTYHPNINAQYLTS